jgi:large subunit ribosomal protein L9
LTQANKRRLESLKQRRAEREAHEYNTMAELAKSVSKLTCIVQVKTGEDGKMFGSVTAGTVADQLKHQFDISLDKRKIQIEHPIRALGEHEVELRLHQEVATILKVRVESITPLPTPAEAPVSEPGKEDRHERRGRRGEATHREGAVKAEAGEKKPSTARGEKAARTDRPARPPKSAKAEKAE